MDPPPPDPPAVKCQQLQALLLNCAWLCFDSTFTTMLYLPCTQDDALAGWYRLMARHLSLDPTSLFEVPTWAIRMSMIPDPNHPIGRQKIPLYPILPLFWGIPVVVYVYVIRTLPNKKGRFPIHPNPPMKTIKRLPRSQGCEMRCAQAPARLPWHPIATSVWLWLGALNWHSYWNHGHS